MKYAILLRGINVGGKATVPMAQLRDCLESAGLQQVKTYINSGNVLFESDQTDTLKLTKTIESAILKKFGFAVPAIVISQKQLESIIKNLPHGWGSDPVWKYNLIFIKPPYEMEKVVADIGELKPGIEHMTVGDGVLYQTMSIKLFGRTTTGKLASKPVYQRMTIRTHRTIEKLLSMMQTDSSGAPS